MERILIPTYLPYFGGAYKSLAALPEHGARKREGEVEVSGFKLKEGEGLASGSMNNGIIH